MRVLSVSEQEKLEIALREDLNPCNLGIGHASVNITLNRYVHPSMELKRKNMNMLSDLFAVK